MPMMIKEGQNFEIDWRVEHRPGSFHIFCQIFCDGDGLHIGNSDEWSVVSLMIESISDMADRLKSQTSLEKKSLDYLSSLNADDLFLAFYSWQWGDGNWMYQRDCPLPSFSASNFYALPMGTEVFDGENAYLLFIPDCLSRFIWRDYESKEIKEHFLNFDVYLNKWESVRKDLARAT